MASKKSNSMVLRDGSAAGEPLKERSKLQIQKGNLKTLPDLAAKLDQTDEMKLKMMTALEREGLVVQPSDMIYPAELNAHLLDQLHVMTGENSQLRKMLFEKDKIIEEHEDTVSDLKTRIRDIISGTGPAISSKSAGVISAKITELCKQNRHLVAEIESFKSRNGAMERKIMQMDLLNKQHENLDICMCKEDAALDTVSADQLKELNMKLATVNKRLTESKRKNLELKNEIIAATKILQNELGNKFTSLKELQNDVAGWKGRAEKIVLLEARIKELENMLNISHEKDKELKHPKADMDYVIKDLESKRKREIEHALKDYNALKQENQDLKKKLDGARCRVRNLECDHTTLRQKMLTYTDKSNADDMLINEQRNQIKALEVYYQEMLRENTSKMLKMQYDIEESHKSSANTVTKIECLRKQAAEKAKKIEELRSQLQRYEECSLQSVFFTPMRTATDNEIQKLSTLVVTLNERLDKERHNWEELDAAHQKLREKKKRLERKVNALEEEVRLLQESKRGSRLSRSSIPKSEQRELMFSKLKQKPSQASSPGENDESVKQSTSTESSPLEPTETLDKEELKFKLLLTEEKLKSIEDKLKMVEEEKQEDYVHLTDMIQTSKQLFNDALMVLQKEKCLCN